MPSQTLSLIFVIAVVASIIVQACFFVGLFVVIRKALSRITKVTEDLSGKASPIVAEVRTLVQDISPRIRAVTANVADITEAVREQTRHVNSSVEDVVDRTHAQARKVDDMVSAVLGSISHAGATVQSGVAKPVRKASGVVHGVRVGLETLFGGTARPERETHRETVNSTTGVRPRSVVIADQLDEDLEIPAISEAQTIQPPPATSSRL